MKLHPTLILLLAAVTAGCGSASEPAPLTEVTSRQSAVCTEQLDAGRVFTYGVDMTRNTSEGEVTIDSVEFSKSNGLEIIAKKAIFTKSSPDSVVGIVRGWPPEPGVKGMLASEEYLNAPDAEGLVIPPDPKHPVAWLIAFRATSVPARASPLKIRYKKDNGDEFTWHGSVSVNVGDCLKR